MTSSGWTTSTAADEAAAGHDIGGRRRASGGGSMTDTAAATKAGAAGGWPVAGAVVALAVAAVIAVFHATAWSIVTIWNNSETFGHGFLIVPIVAGLIGYRRRVLARLQPRPWPWGLLGIVVAGMAWVVGDAGDISTIRHFAFAAMFPCIVLAVLGPGVARALVFPLAYLFFAVPFGAFLIQPLMILTADMTVGLVRASGVPVYREALQFSLPTGNWSVIEACSGISYLIASLALGVLYAHIMYRSIWRRLLFVAASIVVPIAANGLRAYMIVMIGHLSGMEYAVGVDHLLYGWVFFGIVIFLLFWIGSWWSEGRRLDGGIEARAAGWTPGAAPTALALASIAMVAVALAGVWPVYGAQVIRGGAGSAPELAAPVPGGEWRALASPMDAWRPNYGSPAAELEQYYARAGDVDEPVGLFVGYYQNQLETTEMLAWGHNLAPSSGSGWRRLGLREQAVDGLAAVKPAEAVLGRDRERRLAWRWYWVDGRWTDSERVTLARLFNRGDASAVVVVHAPFDHAPSEVRERLRDLSERILPQLEARLDGN